MDRFVTASSNLDLKVLGHASLMMLYRGAVIHVDPYSEVADYAHLPMADLILITHHHSDHLDLDAITQIAKPDTVVVGSQLVTRQLPGALSLSNGDQMEWMDVSITAVPAYNILQMRSPGEPYHIPGEGNGYVLELDGVRIYIAGDTEMIPEMEQLSKIDIAFLPKNLPYTMSDVMFVEAARAIRPRVLYPYHYFEIDREALTASLPQMMLR